MLFCTKIHNSTKPSAGFKTAPADSLLFIRDARLPESPARLLQAESDGPLKVIFIISSEIYYTWNNQRNIEREQKWITSKWQVCFFIFIYLSNIWIRIYDIKKYKYIEF